MPSATWKWRLLLSDQTCFRVGGELIRVGLGGGCLLKLSTQSCMLPSTYIKEQRFITMQMTIHGACQGVNYMPTYQRSYMTK